MATGSASSAITVEVASSESIVLGAAPTSATALQHPYSLHQRAAIAKLLSAGATAVGLEVTVGGWVKTGRAAGKGAFVFVELNDGSTPKNLQCMVTEAVFPDLKQLTATGTSLMLRGMLEATPDTAKTPLELKVKQVLHIGPCDAASYPIAKGKLPLEFLRTVIHLRPRTNIISAITRIRNALAFATHKFFQQHGFLYCHTPLITASDCEGAGEMFQVTTMLSLAEELNKTPMPSAEEMAAAAEKVQKQTKKLEDLQAAKEKASKIKKEAKDLDKLRENLKKVESRKSAVGGLPRTAAGGIDYSQDFFGKQSFLTVSGQLEAEIYACALTNVYTFGPTFRAENSRTTRHLAEFWMIEPEIAFCDLQGDMQCAEDYVRFCCNYVLETCLDDMEFITERFDPDALQRVRNVAQTPFTRLTYTEAIDVLQEHIKKGKVFENGVEWGIDLASEHERFLAEEVYKGPVICYNYPKGIKAFYMRQNEDGKTVAAMDILVPKVGELVGGSQREERVDKLEERIKEAGLDLATYSWYLDLRRYGTVPHAGFGLGFERLLLFTTGMENIRDVIPFPRWPQHIL